MKGRLVLGVSEEEAVRLCQILLDRDRDDALAFLDEHARNRPHDYIEGG